jgi:lysophospholipase L1-like esterase
MAERSYLPHEPEDQSTNGLAIAGPIRVVHPEPVALGPCRLLLPPTIYAVAGQEVNIYFDNVVLAAVPGQYLFDVTCEKGMQHEKRWFWTPGDEPGDYPLQIEVRDWNDNVLATAGTVIRVIDRECPGHKPFTLLCIGDSLTAASVYPGELLNLFSPEGNPLVTLMGTQHKEGFPAAVRHEGYSGWRYESFTRKWEPEAAPDAEPNMRSSPFLFLENGEPVLSFERYLNEKQGGVRPDFITLFLGINDLFLATEKQRESAVETVIESAKALVASIRRAAPAAIIGIVTPTPPSVSQDSFGETNGNMQTRWAYRKNLLAGLLGLMQAFGEREAENIHLVPAYVNLDCENNFPVVERQINARNAQPVIVCNNEVHPSVPGYHQIADSIYGWIKSQLEKDE